ncbi:MAG: GNAT family N-acetyltransferase [Desulfarculaceae bacterium]
MFGFGPSLELYDASLDFFLSHALNPAALKEHRERIVMRQSQGQYHRAASSIQELLSHVVSDPKEWNQKISQAPDHLQALRGLGFYEPEPCLAALSGIDQLLTLASLAYHPCVISRDSFMHPGQGPGGQLDLFCGDLDANPFGGLCKQGLAPRLKNPDLGLVVIFVCSASQVWPALTMARFAKTQCPEARIALALDPARPNPNPPDPDTYWDALVPLDDPRPLMDLAAGVSGLEAHPRDISPPDFTGLPLEDYLAPEPVLSLRAVDPQGGLMQPAALAQTLEHTAKAHQCKALRIVQDLLSPDFIRQTGLNQPDFILGMESSLTGPWAKEDIAAVYEAGVRLITWQTPAGSQEQVKDLTKTLWASSKAGLWNHIVLASPQNGGLDPALARFIATNPHLCHSRQSPAPAEPEGAEPGAQGATLEITTAYSSLSPLPGHPFWNHLLDNAYLLLLQKKWGRKELFRLRVRDDGCTTYTLGQNLQFLYLPPEELPDGFFEDICRLVEAGEAVGTKWIRYNLERAFLIGHAVEEGVVVGTVSLKHPREEFLSSLKQKTGLDLSNYVERGYNSARPEYRGLGIGTRLVKGLTRRATEIDQKLYSTIHEDNLVAQKIALDAGTKKVATYFSDALHKNIGVWIPEWMLDKDQTS